MPKVVALPLVVAYAVYLAGAVFAQQDEELFVAKPLTETGGFTTGIEGPACDKDGNIFAVNFAEQGTIGRVTPDGKGEVFVKLPNGSVGNGIRFNRAGTMFVADYVNHNILKIDPVTREVSVLAHEDGMHQPNDLAIAPDGTLYASDPHWKTGTGQLWRIDAQGHAVRLVSDMGTTNGIEISPDRPGTRAAASSSGDARPWTAAANAVRAGRAA